MKGNITNYLEIIVKYFQKRHPNINIEWPNVDISIACIGDEDTRITLGEDLQIIVPKDQEVKVKVCDYSPQNPYGFTYRTDIIIKQYNAFSLSDLLRQIAIFVNPGLEIK
jgi:hypothetical protein